MSAHVYKGFGREGEIHYSTSIILQGFLLNIRDCSSSDPNSVDVNLDFSFLHVTCGIVDAFLSSLTTNVEYISSH